MFSARKRLFPLLLALLLFLPALPGGAEEGQTVYFFGNFAFGMSVQDVRAMDSGGAAITGTDTERKLQRMSFLSGNFTVTLWFDGLDDGAPLTEMDFAFFMDPDTVLLRDGQLEISTTAGTVNTVYSYVESLCKKTFGKGKNVPEGALPVPSLLFPDENSAPSLTRLRVYTLPDAGKADVIVHLLANGETSVNYVILRQMEK